VHLVVFERHRACLSSLAADARRAATCDIDFGTKETGWLFQQRELHSRRAPGNTCLSALRATKSLGQPARNDSKGCGGVMRVAPVGLFGWREMSPQQAFRLGTELAALTHGHPTGAPTGGVFAVLIQMLVDGTSLPDALVEAKRYLRDEPRHEETLRAIESAEKLTVMYRHSMRIHRRAISFSSQVRARHPATQCSLCRRQGSLEARNQGMPR
jgi:ADP-ribosylglycohydrolase